MWRIAKTFDFDAAHWLPLVPDGHKCKRMHGHTYRVELVVQGLLDDVGFVCDYAVLAEAWKSVHDQLDHRTLNDVPGLENPTTEVLAAWILSRVFVPGLVAVRVYESSSTWAEVSRPALADDWGYAVRLKKASGSGEGE